MWIEFEFDVEIEIEIEIEAVVFAKRNKSGILISIP